MAFKRALALVTGLGLSALSHFPVVSANNAATARQNAVSSSSVQASRDLARMLPHRVWNALSPAQQEALRARLQQARSGTPLPDLCFAPNTPWEIVQAYQMVDSSLGAYRVGGRWTETATNVSLNRGDPMTLTWNLVPDGTSIPAYSGGFAPSNLQARFNAIYGETNCATLRRILREVFARYEQLTGIRYIEVAYDDSAQVNGGNAGVLHTRADIRIGGNTIDGNSNVLAFNYFPTFGDMVIDTADNFYENTASDSLRLRNVLAHEHGHGLGLNHVCPLTQTKLMEPYASTAFSGPQFDDILGVQRNYGDTYESPANNDTPAASTPLGTLAPGTASRETISIDGSDDKDLFRFNLDGVGRSATVTVTPSGAAYPEAAQNGDGSCPANSTSFDPTNQVNLIAELLDGNGNVIAYADDNPAGGVETISAVGLSNAGPYYVRISGSGADTVQAYSFSLTTAARSNAAPAVTVSLSPDEPRATDTLTATASATDPDGGTPTISYVWKRNGATIFGQTGSTLDLTLLPNVGPGDVLRVIAMASDGETPNGQATDSVLIKETAGLVVTSLSDTTADDGLITLREAISYAETIGGTQGITFQAGLNGTINLVAELPAVDGSLSSLSITGPGQGIVSISGQNARRIMQVSSGKTLTLSGLSFVNGWEPGLHGGLFSLGGATFTATGCSFSDSQARNLGGAIYGSGTNTLNLTSCIFSSNEAFYGGAINIEAGTLYADSCSFGSNGAGIDGGAIRFIGSAMTLKNCVFSNNRAGTDGSNLGNGGAVRDSLGALTIQNCTFASNSCDGNGGAVYDFGVNSRQVNNTYSGNTATTAGSALYLYQSSHVIINTIFNAPDGATASIAVNVATVSASSTNNLASDSAGGLLPAVASNLTNTPAGLNALENNGGLVKTMALQSDSAAQGAGFDSTAAPDSLANDARGPGFPRKSGGIVDIGAFEYQAASLSVNDVTVTEGNANATFTVKLSTASTQSVSVDFATAAGSTNPATANSDFTPASGTLFFTPGQTSKTISVPLISDTLDEDNETFVINLSNPDNAVIGDAQGIGTITDNDAAPTLSIVNSSLSEGDSGTKTMSFALTLSAPSGRSISVHYATDADTATAGSDFVAQSGNITFNPGETAKSIDVIINGDTANERDERLNVNLTSPVNVKLARTGAKGIIVNDDPLPGLSVNDVSLAEGNSGSKLMTFTVTLSAASARSVTFNYATDDGTATAANNDYVAKTNGVLTIGVGQTSKTFTVTIRGDTINENDEKFNVVLSAPVNARIDRARGTGTIVNDDPLPTVSIGDASITEGDSGTKNLTFTLTLSAASARSVSVNYATSNGTALAGSDYIARSGTVTFGAGQTGKTITVSIKGDQIDEGDEVFSVSLSSPVNASIADGQGVGTITDDDASG